MMKHNHAFTLVELSIVLVILGLLVGGVLAGQNLIRAAEIRNVASSFTHYETAVLAFREKYFALPGDITNATDFWGAADADHATCIALDETSPSTGTETCNGNGDDYIVGSGAAYERFRAWQHLANADLIPGQFTGVEGSATTSMIPGLNSPESPVSGGTWAFSGKNPNNTGNVNFWNHILFSSIEFRDELATDYVILTPEEMWSLDSKIDDGVPGQGKVASFSQARQPNCTDGTDPATAEYVLSYQDKACSVVMILNRRL